MICRLRWKLVAVNMTIVTLVTALMLGNMYYTTLSGFERDSENFLRHAAEGGEPWRHPEMVKMPYFTLSVTEQNNVVVTSNHFYEVDDPLPVEEIAAHVLSSSSDLGYLNQYQLRYYRVASEGSYIIACSDTSFQDATMDDMLIHYLQIGGVMLAAFFLLALLLSHWAVAPVEQSAIQQRQFVADASHELKTPLTIILSNTEILQSLPNDDPQKQAARLENIQAAALRMKGLVDDMLELARSDAAKTTSVHRRLNFSEEVTNSVLLFESVAYEAGKTIQSNISDELFLFGDPLRLHQLIDILLDNAVKYSSLNGHIDVRLHSESRRVRLTVRSDGEPIPPDQLTHLFERFYRADAARTEGGCGLGLSIAQTIVAEHKGKIRAVSHPSEGNTFIVTFPQA